MAVGRATVRAVLAVAPADPLRPGEAGIVRRPVAVSVHASSHRARSTIAPALRATRRGGARRSSVGPLTSRPPVTVRVVVVPLEDASDWAPVPPPPSVGPGGPGATVVGAGRRDLVGGMELASRASLPNRRAAAPAPSTAGTERRGTGRGVAGTRSGGFGGAKVPAPLPARRWKVSTP